MKQVKLKTLSKHLVRISEHFQPPQVEWQPWLLKYEIFEAEIKTEDTILKYSQLNNKDRNVHRASYCSHKPRAACK